MAIATYAELQDEVTAYLTLDAATAAKLPTFIRLAEAELGRLLLPPEREVVETASTVAGTQSLALPTGYRQIRSILLDDDYPLTPVTLNTVLSGGGVSGKPTMYCVANQAIYLNPIPDAVYTITAYTLADIPALSASATTNWLLDNHPDAYLYATIYQTEVYLVNDERAANAQSALGGIVNQINAQGNRYRNASPMRLRSPVVV